MKVGILTLFHGNRNWGGVLQGYALKTLLETRFPGVQADLLIYKNGENIVYSSALKQLSQYAPGDVIKKVASKITSKINRGYRQRIQKRIERFSQFEKALTTNWTVYTDETLSDAAREYDCLICGSDQVWNPNVGKAGFFLAHISDECKKISYAASIARDDLSEHEQQIMLPLIERFDAISVREKTAKRILEQHIRNKPINEVLDPVFMLSPEEWSEVADKSENPFVERYAVGFFFGESYKKRVSIELYCEEKGLKLKTIPYAKGEYLATEEQGNAELLYDVGPYEFVKLLQNAQCVFTDSFHGAVFSIIFRKQFCVFERSKQSKVSQNSRLYDLLAKFGLSDRLIQNTDGIAEVMENTIDYEKVVTIQQKCQKESLEFLENVLAACTPKPESVPSHVGELEHWECTGCGLCKTQCPVGSITMQPDKEGFCSPVVDTTACIKCGLCVKICRSKSSRMEAGEKTIVGFHKDAKVRANSSSGGFFYALAESVLKRKGVVYGAAFSDDFSVRHQRATKLNELEPLLTSKYVQSDTTDVYLQVRDDLQKGIPVLFVGTPCQVAAMRRYAGDNVAELYLADFICHGVPSPGVWESYLRFLRRERKSAIKSISFRDKAKGWHDYRLKIVFGNGVFRESREKNRYMNSFLSDKNIRKSCYRCGFKDKNSRADITLGDAWGVEKEFPDWSDDKGTSVAVIRTQKGEALLERVAEMLEYRESSYMQWKKFNPSLECSTVCPRGRAAFFEEYRTLSVEAFWKKNGGLSGKKKLRYIAKKAAKSIGIDKALRKRL